VAAPHSESRTLAVYVDFENLALAFKDDRRVSFDIQRVLDRLLEKGNVVVRKAYADWSRFRHYTKPMHEAGFELQEIPKRSMTGKNSADIRLVVDALDLGYSKEHIDTFVIVSGDSDFSPLVAKLRENGKIVIGLGMRESTSQLLADHCDEFLFYDDLEGEKDKETVVSEETYGYRSFTELLEDAQKAGFIELDIDERSGTYKVTKLRSSRRRRSSGSRSRSKAKK